MILGDDAIVLVHPDAEGQAIGTLLRRWAEARAAERGTATVRQFAAGSNDSGRGLLRAAGRFETFRRAGLAHAELSVHVRNHGALRLYESAGMRTTWQAERWEKARGPA